MRTLELAARSVACVSLVGCTTRGPTPSSDDDGASLPVMTEDASIPVTTGDASSSFAAPTASTEVRWFGALYAIMHEGRTEAAVRLADVLPGPDAWGVGALEGLAGEVTIVDDIVWLARPNPDGTANLTHGAIGDVDEAQGAALLVVANVAAWDELAVTTNVAWSDLDGFLESALMARGEALDRPVPLRIDGPTTSLLWHVVDGSKMQPGASHAQHASSGVRGVLEHVDVQLVGFFSRSHQGVFTHMGSYSHLHFVTRDAAVSGHVDGVDVLPGARLLLPRR